MRRIRARIHSKHIATGHEGEYRDFLTGGDLPCIRKSDLLRFQ